MSGELNEDDSDEDDDDTNVNEFAVDDLMEFELELTKAPVKFKEPDTGNVVELALIELTGADRDKYLNTLPGRTGAKSGRISNFSDMQLDLILRCLFYATHEKDADTLKVTVVTVSDKYPAAKIRKLPARVQMSLFTRIQKMSGLENDAKDEAKND